MDVKILVVDDDQELRSLIADVLDQLGYEVDVADGVKTAIELFKENDYTIMITDKNMPGLDGNTEGGMDLLRFAKTDLPLTQVIMMTGYASIETAIEAMKLGAFDYLLKPIKINTLQEKIDRILDYQGFINPENTIQIYKEFHNEILNIFEQSTSLTDQEMHKFINMIDEKIDHFFLAQKKWERTIIDQRNALGNIAALMAQLEDSIPTNDETKDIIKKINQETEKRL